MTSRPPRPALAILIAVAAVGPLALNIFTPSMPGMQRVFDVSYGTIQLTITLYLFGTAVAQLLYGPLSDRFGRRPVLLIGLCLFLLGSIASAFATSIVWLLISRTLQAVGGCAGLVLSRAIVRDMHSREKSASMIGYITVGMVVVPMISPLIGGVLDQWFNWRAGFLFVTAAGFIVLLATLLKLPETNFDLRPIPGLRGILLSYSGLLKSREFRHYAFNAAFTSGAFFAFLSGGPFIAIELMAQPTSVYGICFVFVALGYMSGNFLTGRLAERMGTDTMITLGSSLSLAGAVTMCLLALTGNINLVTIFGPMALITFGNGLSLPSATAGSVSVNPKIAGAAAGLAGFMQMTLSACITLFVGYLQSDSALPMILTILATSAIATSIHAHARIRKAKTAPQP
ncbi:multidrug effflux MFS transporter [Denitrobaculum tricleocarpae]|uniref:multidrug effflux MFS transporter n=1 Tax=Denitrobaculum tricleocarpae TaxID=2591009 RepID=UPI0015D14938|nr:multidrug effflux MFS transporter [Denitrobaculum tricleocarpae]